MDQLDFAAPAEVYTAARLGMRNRSVKFRRFDTSAEAIRFVIEGQDAKLLPSTVIEVADTRIEAGDIRAHYDSPGYPLPRTAVGAAV